MLFTRRDQYVVATAIEIGRKEMATNDYLADLFNLSHGYMEQLTSSLREAGIVQGFRGSGGGMALTRKPEDINVLYLVESTKEMERITPPPQVKKLHNQLETVLRVLTLADLL